MDKLKFDYKKIGRDVLNVVGKYKVIATALVILVVFGFSLVRINQLSDPEPDQARLNDQLGTYRKVQIDDQTVEAVQALVESNVNIDPNFGNRDNPFAE